MLSITDLPACYHTPIRFNNPLCTTGFFLLVSYKKLGMVYCIYTVNSEIFMRVLFSQNFAYAKFRENRILVKWRNHSVVY